MDINGKCNQCGRCCQEEVCLLGEKLFETKEIPCRGLVFKDNKYYCGLVLMGDELIDGLSKHLRLLLGIGICCDSFKAKK